MLFLHHCLEKTKENHIFALWKVNFYTNEQSGLYICHALSLIEGLANWPCFLLHILLTIAILLFLCKGIL